MARNFRYQHKNPKPPKKEIIVPPKRLNQCAELRLAFIKHYLRRFLVKPSSRYFVVERYIFFRNLAITVLRASFISIEHAKQMGYLLKGSMLKNVGYKTKYVFHLSSWFAAKTLFNDLSLSQLTLVYSRNAIEVLLAITQAGKITLALGDGQFADDNYSLYHFEEVQYSKLMESLIGGRQPKLEQLDTLLECSSMLTTVPYCDKLYSFEGTNFGNSRTLLVQPGQNPTIEFLKEWKSCRWYFEQLIFKDTTPCNLNPETYSFFISYCLYKVWIPLVEYNDVLFDANQFEILSEFLRYLLVAFPKIAFVTATVKQEADHRIISKFFREYLKRYLVYMALHASLKDIDWPVTPKILIEFISLFSHDEPKTMKYQHIFEEAVEECRQKVKALKWIRLKGPSVGSLEWQPSLCSYAQIEMAVRNVHYPDKVIYFQVLFKAKYDK